MMCLRPYHESFFLDKLNLNAKIKVYYDLSGIPIRRNLDP